MSHGSRNKQSQNSFCLLVEEIRQQLECKKAAQRILIETANLELGEYSLCQQIEKIAQRDNGETRKHLKILPLFLLPGVHVQEDIPKEIAEAQEKLGAKVDLEILPYLGSYQGLTRLLENLFQVLNSRANLNNEHQKRILVAHGSSLKGGNQACESVASQLVALIAYWSREPHLKTIVEQLITQKATSIDIVPYFIFEGGITQSLQEEVEDLQINYPEVQFQLSPPLSPTLELASLIVEEILK